eukprot:Phypoly_transcript_03501.p1 GENE.Phypoly_transcript_03501~~Phypoly_transcript_03501.p1  ORF type:complete len:706 (+),score=130.61 Phypoly_transcript_03501:304-2421(+)
MAAAMKKGERVQAKLVEIGSQRSEDWRKYFTTLGQLQEVLNGSQMAWTLAMKDLFITPLKDMQQENFASLKNKSKMVQAALARFDEEQEKTRSVVQSMLSKPTLMSSVQPVLFITTTAFQETCFYDSMKVKEELFSTKKNDMLRELEHFQFEKAYEIALLWSQVCSKQPHLSNPVLIKRFALERFPSPPLSDWTSYSSSKGPALAELLDGAEYRPEIDNPRNSLAVTFYKGLKQFFQGHTKLGEHDMLPSDLNGSSDSTTFGTDPRTDPSMQISPHNTSILTSGPPSAEDTPILDSQHPSTPMLSSRPPFLDALSPYFSPIPGLDADRTPSLEPRPYNHKISPDQLQRPTELATLSPADSPAYTSTALTISETLQSNTSCSTQSSPTFLLEHLSPCSIASSLFNQSQDFEDLARAQEIADSHTELAQKALDAVQALRMQNATLAHTESARRSVHYAPNVVSASYEAAHAYETSSGEDSSTQEDHAYDSCSTQSDTAEELRSNESDTEEYAHAYKESVEGAPQANDADELHAQESDPEDSCSQENDTKELRAQESSGSFTQENDTEEACEQETGAENPHSEDNDAESSPAQEDESDKSFAIEIEPLSLNSTFSEYEGDADYSGDGYETSMPNSSLETLLGDSGASDDSNASDSGDAENRTDTGEESDDEREETAVRKSRGGPKVGRRFRRLSQNAKKGDTSRPWTV